MSDEDAPVSADVHASDNLPADPVAQEQVVAKKRGYGLPRGLSMTTVLRIAAMIPDWAWRPLIRFAAWLSVRRGYRAGRQWRLNAGVMLGRPATDDETRAGMRSWFRNLANSVRIGRYSRNQILRLVQVDEASVKLVRDAWATTGAIIALPHLGDWDLAGAWACATGMPVSSVAERLPDEEFEYFLKVRRHAGMTIYSHKDADSLDKLAGDLATGHLVALVADRDLSRHSVPVVWQTPSGPQHVTMPPGPAVLAQRTGAQLLVARTLYRRGGITLQFLGPVEVDPGDDGIARTTQRLADVFAALVAEKPVDWHLMQRFFPGLTAE